MKKAGFFFYYMKYMEKVMYISKYIYIKLKLKLVKFLISKIKLYIKTQYRKKKPFGTRELKLGRLGSNHYATGTLASGLSSSKSRECVN